MRGAGAVLLAVALAGARGAGACPELPVAPDGANEVELQLGATNVNAALGNGALTAAFSRCGELTVLKWPGPSYYDQLQYLTSNAPNARLLPHLGALDDQGAFPGLAYQTAAGRRGFTWLRDDAWTHAQRYSADTSDVLVDEAVNAALGLRVTGTHFVLPDRSVLVNHYEVMRTSGSPVRSGTLVFYANFAPTLSRMPLFPVADWGLDFENDFALLYDRREHALLHFLPAGARQYPHDYAPVNALLRAPPRTRARLRRAVGRIVAGLSEPGVYIAAGARPRDDGFQAGFDDAPICRQQTDLIARILGAFDLPPALADSARTLFSCGGVVANPDGPLAACRADNGWTYTADSAYADAQRGRLSGSPIAACQANGALARRLRFRRGRATATFDVAIGATRDEAYGLLRAARAGDPAAERAATETWWADWLAPSIELGATSLAACMDPMSGLQCPANEDDNIPLTQGLQGAAAVLLGLESGVGAAAACGFDAGEVAGWQMRADTLAQAIREHFLVAGPPAHFEGKRPGWLLWPVAFFAPGDPAALSHAAWLEQTVIDPILDRTALTGGYDAESLLARAELFRVLGDGAALAAAQGQVRFFVRELTTPGTLHLSEFYARVGRDLNGDGVSPDYLPENDVPHVWEHAYLYLAAMAAFGS